MGKQDKEAKVKPKPEERVPSSGDQLSKFLEKDIQAPPIDETMVAIEQALYEARKRTRTHHCRICERHECTHYERVYDDNGEEVDMQYDPETGKFFEDREGGG